MSGRTARTAPGSKPPSLPPRQRRSREAPEDRPASPIGAIGPIRRALNPAEPYWRKWLLLNLILAARGLYLGAAIPLTGAVIEMQQPGAAHALFWLTLATCIYSMVTMPFFTPRDTGHTIPRALAPMLIVVGFAVS